MIAISCVGACDTCGSSFVLSIELTSAGANCDVSVPSIGVSEDGDTTSVGSMEGTMLQMSETDVSVGKGTSGGTGDSEDGRLCCGIKLGTSTASAFTDN